MDSLVYSENLQLKTGSTIHFYGQDDFSKLKSNTIDNVIAVWYEEAAEFNSFEEFDQTNATFMRNQAQCVPYVKFFYSYTPPRNPYSWINEWVEELRGEEDALVQKLDESSWLVNGIMNINDFNEYFGTIVTSNEVDTIGGYFTYKSEIIPSEDKIGTCLEIEMLMLELMQVNEATATQLKVTRIEE